MESLAQFKNSELIYIVLLFALFVLPRFLQRFRLPSAITCVFLGLGAGVGLSLFAHDNTIGLLATFGIVSLFLFAGLEINFAELRSHAWILLQYIGFHLVGLAAISYAAMLVFDLPVRPAVLVALALLTPSAGFILDSLKALHLDERERFWVRTKVIAIELVALAALFAVVQSSTATRFSVSLLVLIGLIAILPLLLKFFAKVLLPYAPRSEFAFLLMLAVVCAFVTRELGVYYLVGAFVAGVAAQRFREELPAMASEQMLHAVELFASVFVPFYFFNAGLHLNREDFSVAALFTGGAFLAIMIPVRLFWICVHRRIALKESFVGGLRIGVAMLPTLVFTLVIAGILRDTFEVSGNIFGGLIIYTLANTLIPGFVLRIPPPSFDTPHISTVQPPQSVAGD